MSLAEWDELVAQIKPGGMRLEEIYHAAEQRYRMSR